MVKSTFKMGSGEDLKLPPIACAKSSQSSRSESNSSNSGRRFKSFKQLVRVVGKNSKWTKDFNEEVQGDQSRNITIDDKRLTFNVSAFKAHVRSVGDLSSEVKNALVKDSTERTRKDLSLIQTLMMRIKAFETYSTTLKAALARVLMYEAFEKGRVVIQQGHAGVSFYFIVNGTVALQREEKDKRTSEKHIQCLGELSGGDAFGELALLQNSTRTATIVCKMFCEFLKVDKVDFNEILRNGQQFDYERKMTIFLGQIHFQKWSMQEIRSANANSKVITFPPNSVILKAQDDEYVYFVQSGRCKVIREVTVVKTKLPYGKSRLALVSPGKTLRLLKDQCMEKRYLVLMTIDHGGYFNVGEDLNETWIISDNKVECLLVQRTVFKKDGGRELNQLRQKLISHYPSRNEAFKSYLTERNWRKYKKALIEDLVRIRCKPVSTTYQDIPYVIRKRNERYVRKL